MGFLGRRGSLKKAGGEPSAREWAFRIDDIDVRSDRLLVRVCVSEERFCFSSPGLIAGLLSRFPTILSHTCVNDRGETFMSVAAHTSVAHLFEHLAIDEQARLDETSEEVTFVGKTAWTNREKREACVQVSYVDEFAARRALVSAQCELNDALLAREWQR